MVCRRFFIRVCAARAARWLAAVAALWLLCLAQAAVAQTIVLNGDLSSGSGNTPSGWKPSSFSPTASDFSWQPGVLTITNREPNDAYWAQRLHLDAGWYHFTAELRAQGVGPHKTGAALTMMQYWIGSEELHGDTDWHPVGFYLKVGEKGADLDLACRLGGFASLNVGSVSCRDIQAVRCQAPPAGTPHVFDLDLLAAHAPPSPPAGGGGVNLVAWSVIGVLLLLATVFWVYRRPKRPSTEGPPSAARIAAEGAGGGEPVDFRAGSEAAHWFSWAGAFSGIFVAFSALYAASGAYHPTVFNASVSLAHSILRGHFYLIDPTPAELVIVNGWHYVPYGIGPSLLMLPFVAIWGLHFNQSLFGALVAAVAVSLWWGTLGNLGIRAGPRIWLTLLLGIGSPLWFYGGHQGSVWFLAHVVAVFGLMLALWDTTGRGRGWLAGLGLGLAILSRPPVLLSAPFFIGMLWQSDGQRGPFRKEACFAAALGALLAFQAYYDLARFGNPLDTGYTRFVDSTPLWVHPWGLFSIRYIPQNFPGYFLSLPARVRTFPWFNPSQYGFSIFISTPAILLALGADYRRLINLLALASCVAIQLLYLSYFWSGTGQFGQRYAVDYLPFVMLLAATAVKDRPGLLWPLIAVTLGGAAVEVWGLTWFTQHGW